MQVSNTIPTTNLSHYPQRNEEQLQRPVTFAGRQWRHRYLYEEILLMSLCAFIFFRIFTEELSKGEVLAFSSLTIIGLGIKIFLLDPQNRAFEEITRRQRAISPIRLPPTVFTIETQPSNRSQNKKHHNSVLGFDFLPPRIL
jgi:hypothetical protein